ncbi:MAG: flavin reductase (DIM6/NTAB) family NADH-FMN oxidoreductase RutF [Maribacter sp.]
MSRHLNTLTSPSKLSNMEMRTIDPKEVATKDLHQFLLGAVAPRPIAFASTVDEDGNKNLAPYSFFNAFSSNPPTLVFSSNRRVVDNTTKDTLHNIQKTGEVVINVVNYNIVRQMAIAGVQYDTGVDEFVKAGLTPIASDLVAPYRVKESPAQMECKVRDIITLGEGGGAGHLIVCDVVKMHIAENVIDDKGRIDPHKIDLMGRMGRAFYVRCSGTNVFPIVQPVTQIAIGFDALPKAVKESKILTGNNLAQLAGLLEMPSQADADELKKDVGISTLLKMDNTELMLHNYAKQILDAEGDGAKAKAMKVLMLR